MSLTVDSVQNAAVEVSDLDVLSDRAEDAARMLRLLGNQHRLMILCGADEMPVGALVDELGISQSALSQHLARLRQDGLVTFRRDAQTLFYRVADARAARLLMTLKDIYCPD